MIKIMNSFAALLLLQVRPITGPSGEIEPKYLDFTAKVREKSHELPFKTDAYTGCLWKNASDKECSKYSVKLFNYTKEPFHVGSFDFCSIQKRGGGGM